MHLSVIIPAYNEEQRIEKTLKSVGAYLRKKKYSYEIIVVNDGSTDRTRDIVDMLTFSIPNLKLLDNEKNHGKGWVVRQGMLAATGMYRLFMDADGSTSIDHIDKLLPYAEKGNDIVISSRRVLGAELEVPQTFLRDLLGTVFRSIVHIMVPLGIVDSQNGFKLFTARAAELVFKRQRTFTWSFDVEILAIARRLDLSIAEVGVRWVNDGRSRVTLMGMVMMLVEVLQIRMSLWYGTYDELAPEFSTV